MRKYILVFLVMLTASAGFAQGTTIPLGTQGYHIIDRLDIKYSKIIPIVHTTDKAYFRGDVAKVAETMMLSNLRFNKVQQSQLQYLVDDNPDFLDSLKSINRRPAWKLYREPASFLHYSSRKKGLYDIRLNPVFDLKMGYESGGSGRFVFSSVRGLEVRGNIKRVFSFYFNVLGNASRPPLFVTDKVRRGKYRYVPGQSYWKDYSSKIFKFDDGVDYFDARGYINVNVLKYINISLGRDKFFIGNGQRSMFLSDFSAPYLFLRTNIKFWRISYQSIIAELNSQYIRGADQLLPKKYMAVHHLSIQATHWLNIGLFESVIMKRSNQFELQYLNPIIFYRAVEHAIGSPDNVLLGGDFKINLVNHLSIYGQVLFDELNFKNAFAGNGWWANKWALQFGLKYIDIIPNLDAQIETNIARPFIYTHEGDINYTHYNQPLAHPLGANFYEVILQLRYQPLKQLFINAKYIASVVGNDTLDINGNVTNYGGDIFTSSGGGTSVTREFGNKIGQGAKANINYFQLVMSYTPWHNIYIDLELLYRSKSGKVTKDNASYAMQYYQSTFFVGIGLRMNIGHKNYEF